MIFETLLIGLLLALVYTEATGTSPGGLVVPGYLALYLDQPLRVAGARAGAGRPGPAPPRLSPRLILFGRRRFVLMILLGAFLAQAWFFAHPRLFGDPLELRVIGWVIPGLLASNLERQRTLPTLASLATVAVMTYFVARLVSLI
jgi:hypothetical protein